MKQVKIMPCLDMKDGRVVKGVHFVDIQDAGDPVENDSFPGLVFFREWVIPVPF